ncbi:tetratricopeptide (TPR) repeat protein [Streptomyces demainii]|uniref:Tetratricopeptide (TPR) repeat protein n=1 Tax=Streptomyces demainii TaxID=588122 RepID=A0ABT9KR54_9ACTN|nr:tetratricopeptide (TPR) repeat protein [Streptomyces demainii]
MSLPRTLAEDVAKNLVMVAKLLDDEPERAYQYSRVALRLASRVAAVREAAGFASYAVGKYAEALAEFRAARRMTGSSELWPVMADCERGMGRPERALAMAGEPEVQKLDRAGQVEMRMVAAGARRDMGQADAAVVTLQSPELASNSIQPWTARLRYAYADALLAVGREDEAREWFAKALEADQGGTTDASDRLAELDGVEFLDALDPEQEVDDASRPVAESPVEEPEVGERKPEVGEREPEAEGQDEEPGGEVRGEEQEGEVRGEKPEAEAGEATSGEDEDQGAGGQEEDVERVSEATSESEGEPETGSEAEPKVESEGEPKTGSEAESKAESEAEPKAESEVGSETGSAAESEVESEGEPKTESEAGSKTASEGEPKAEPEAGAESEARAQKDGGDS